MAKDAVKARARVVAARIALVGLAILIGSSLIPGFTERFPWLLIAGAVMTLGLSGAGAAIAMRRAGGGDP